MDLADLVLAPSAFVRDTIAEFHPDKHVALASYGVDAVAWPSHVDPPKPTSRFCWPGRARCEREFPFCSTHGGRQGSSTRDCSSSDPGSSRIEKA